jgi:hypothetical protein
VGSLGWEWPIVGGVLTSAIPACGLRGHRPSPRGTDLQAEGRRHAPSNGEPLQDQLCALMMTPRVLVVFR